MNHRREVIAKHEVALALAEKGNFEKNRVRVKHVRDWGWPSWGPTTTQTLFTKL